MAKKTTVYNWDARWMSALRKIWRFSPERRAVIDAAKCSKIKGNLVCHECTRSVHAKLCAVDHVEPVVKISGFESWDDVRSRMQNNRQVVVCDECHAKKTKQENEERRAYKKAATKKPDKKTTKKEKP